jgi:hypothetical protein
MTTLLSTPRNSQDQVYSDLADRRPTDVELCHQFLAAMGHTNPATREEKIHDVMAAYDVIFDANYFLFCRGITYGSAEEMIRRAEERGWRASVRNQQCFPKLRSALEDIGPNRRLVEEFLIAADCPLLHVNVVVADALLRAAVGYLCDHAHRDDVRHFCRSPEVLIKAAHRLGWCADARTIMGDLLSENRDKAHDIDELFAAIKSLIRCIRTLDWNPAADTETRNLELH